MRCFAMGRAGRVVGWAVGPQASIGPLQKSNHSVLDCLARYPAWTPFEGHLASVGYNLCMLVTHRL
jgi:hypothetical protein